VDWFAFAFRWFFALWLLGWLTLPLSRRVLSALPDGGLAAGRVLAPTLASLPLFWLASFHALPMATAPLFLVAPILGSLILLRSSEARTEFFGWVRNRRIALLWSDAVFLAGFALFLWIRMRHPELNSLEKPMDSAILNLLLRSDYLPFDSFWFSGTPFTNYYYYGQFVSANLARALGTHPPYVYNLAHPLWCAFLLSTLWPLCAALCSREARPANGRGLAATCIIALCGHYEPLRQIIVTRKWWPLDWWTTSRVIPNTINEYPLFTMTAGDLHAHFFALTFTVTLATLCYALFHSPVSEFVPAPLPAPTPVKKRSKKAERASKATTSPASVTEEATLAREATHETHWYTTLIVLGLLMGIMYMTNTWDLPVSMLLVTVCAALTRPGRSVSYWLWLAVPPIVAYVASWPYRRLFAMPLSAAQFDLFIPPLIDFLLLWGLILVLLAIGTREWWQRRSEPIARFSLLVTAGGLLALFVPFVCFLQSQLFTGGSMDHLNMVFKMGLQAWLLLGLAGACGTLATWQRWPRPVKWGFPLLFVVPVLCSACIIWTWVWRDAPRDADGKYILSLDGLRHMPPEDRAALLWLYENTKPGDAVVEAVSDRAYDRWGRVSWLSGVPTPLGWIQHSKQFGATDEEIQRRYNLVLRVYAWRDDTDGRNALEDLRKLGVRWVFVGDLERQSYPPDALQRLRTALGTAYENGDTFIAKVP
jgi:uncharacterized membrane protein